MSGVGTLDPARLPGPVWVVAPHPDDEALGCGALLAGLSDLGREVWALLMTDGGASHPGSARYPRPRLAAARLAEWQAGLAQLGVPADRTRALGLPDGALAACDPATVTRAVAAALAAAPPATLLLPWQRDPHPDHRATWAPVRAALGPGVRVLEYLVWLPERGEPADQPQPGEVQVWHYPVGAARPGKAAAIAAHRSQLGEITDDPHGFVLPERLLAAALDGPELYLERPGLYPAQGGAA